LAPGGPLWIPYVMVADARRTSESAKENGATIAHGPSEVPGGDWVFTGIDPQGAMFAVHSKKRVAAPATAKKEAAKTKTVKAKTAKTKSAKTKSAKPAAKKTAGTKKKPALRRNKTAHKRR